MIEEFFCERLQEAHNVAVTGWSERWAWLEGSSDKLGEELFDAIKNYERKRRDVFWVHWRIDIPRYPDIVRLHVASPKQIQEPFLNDMKRTIVRALIDSDAQHLARQRGYVYKRGRLTSDYDIREHKSTEAFQIALTPEQQKVTPENDIEMIQREIGHAVDEVLLRFVSGLSDYFR